MEFVGNGRNLDENQTKIDLTNLKENLGKISAKIAENGWNLIKFAGNGRNL